MEYWESILTFLFIGVMVSSAMCIGLVFVIHSLLENLRDYNKEMRLLNSSLIELTNETKDFYQNYLYFVHKRLEDIEERRSRDEIRRRMRKK